MLGHLGMSDKDGKDYVSALDEDGLKIILDEIGSNSTPAMTEGTTTPVEGGKTLVLACSSDRGLCGAIHSSVSKLSRRLAAANRSDVGIVVLGDKAKPQICRDSRQNIVMHFNQVGRNIPVFGDSVAIWEQMNEQLDGCKEYTNRAIIYNRFVSVISFDTVLTQIPTFSSLKASEKLAAYEYDPEVLSNYATYLGATRLFWALVEGHAAEMSSKRTAMENATKNSEAVVQSLTVQYNRTRQAVITNELIDIIVGASAL